MHKYAELYTFAVRVLQHPDSDPVQVAAECGFNLVDLEQPISLSSRTATLTQTLSKGRYDWMFNCIYRLSLGEEISSVFGMGGSNSANLARRLIKEMMGELASMTGNPQFLKVKTVSKLRSSEPEVTQALQEFAARHRTVSRIWSNYDEF